ncbi:hypothetical protein [Pelotomaculum sp. FP]|uniref:hypothetical protein n=1 Tax=Pelotomaculum sp. FP TaxID=261474 RepID=UPI001291A8FD|nr:hypothetical protein [Pelotomaculum sp. FP]
MQNLSCASVSRDEHESRPAPLEMLRLVWPFLIGRTLPGTYTIGAFPITPGLKDYAPLGNTPPGDPAFKLLKSFL